MRIASRATEIPDGMEHSERPLGIFVGVAYYESQVHISYHLFCDTGRHRPVPDSRFLFAEKNSCDGCRHNGQRMQHFLKASPRTS
jgi:hypothetical protein